MAEVAGRADLLDLLRCPECRRAGTLHEGTPSKLSCSGCGASFPREDGILDFVRSRSDTGLDVTAYDEQKRVSPEAATALFKHLKALARSAIPDDLGTVLEVGAGTGFLTIGMLQQSTFQRAVITDISPAMLTLCRARVLEHVDSGKNERIAFATYASDDPLFRDGVFDLAIANSVLHHIENYYSFLRDMHNALKPGGYFVCVEPSRTFHEALSRAMADSLCQAMAQANPGDNSDLKKLAGWIFDLRYRLAFPADPAIANLEDKHLFSREELSQAGSVAGFRAVTTTPNMVDVNGASAAREYVSELGISPSFTEAFLQTYLRYADSQFRLLPLSDHASMYVCAFKR